MLSYEWKKLCHSPAALLAAALLILIKLTVFAFQCSNIELSAMDRVMDELYGDSTLLEIHQRVDADLADAVAEGERSVSEDYASGKASIEEYRAWMDGMEDRISTEIALERIKGRVAELMTLQGTYESARAGQLSPAEYGDYIARWKPLRLLHEQAWDALFALENVSFGGYWVLLLVIPLFSEMWDTRMDVLVRTSKDGWERSNRAKRRLSIMAIFMFWLIDCFIDYGLPGIVWGYGAPDAAIQSVTACANMVLPLSLGEYLIACCLLRLGAYFAVYSLAYALCPIIRSTYRAFAVCAGAYMLVDVLNPWSWSVDKLATPGAFFNMNIDPQSVMLIVSGYLAAILLMQIGAAAWNRWVVSNRVSNSHE